MKAKYPSDYIVWTDIQIIIAGNNLVMLIYVAGEKRQNCRRGTDGKGTRANRRRNYGNKIRGTNGGQTRNWVGATQTMKMQRKI